MRRNQTKIKLGARWDDPIQNSRFVQAKTMGLLDFAEVSCPFASLVAPESIEIPLYAHSASERNLLVLQSEQNNQHFRLFNESLSS